MARKTLEDNYGSYNNPATFRGGQSGRAVELVVYPDGTVRPEYVSSDVKPNSVGQLERQDARKAEKAKADKAVKKRFDWESWRDFMLTQAGGATAAGALAVGGPMLVAGGDKAAAYALSHAPGVSAAIGKAIPTAFAIEGARNLFSDNGYRKTLRLINEGAHPWEITTSALGDVLDASMIAPLFNEVVNIGKKGVNTLKEINNNIFRVNPNSYTRGIGRGLEGLKDLVNTGIVRGNPRGTEVTANNFAKLYRKNRFNFRDIVKDTGIKNIENKFFSRTLNEKEFNAIKEASKKYKSNRFVNNNGTITTKEVINDPLIEYNTYEDYVKAIQSDIAKVEQMPNRIALGEVKINTENGIPTNRPIDERFGENSDYVADGTPLSYYYSDGRNPFNKGYDYAGSNYAVRINNPEKYVPFMHEAHMHPSFQYAPRLDDPNVEVFRRLPFGFGYKMNKNTLKEYIKRKQRKSLGGDY